MSSKGQAVVQATDQASSSSAPLLDTLMAAARLFSAITAQSIAQVEDEVTLPQLRALVLASTRSGLNAAAVAQALQIHPSAASRLCDRLVRARLLDRRDRADDRRQVELTPTARGRTLLETVTEHRREVLEHLVARLEPDQRDDLNRVLTALTAVGDQRLEQAHALMP